MTQLFACKRLTKKMDSGNDAVSQNILSYSSTWTFSSSPRYTLSLLCIAFVHCADKYLQNDWVQLVVEGSHHWEKTSIVQSHGSESLNQQSAVSSQKDGGCRFFVLLLLYSAFANSISYVILMNQSVGLIGYIHRWPLLVW